MVGTLPESGLVVVEIKCSVGTATPIPFTSLIVDEVVFDILPAMLCLVECRFVAEVLVDIVEADNSLCLNPLVKVVIHMSSVEVCLVYHRTVRIESLF